MFHFHSRIRNQFVVLPPAGVRIPGVFRRTEFDHHRYGKMMAAMQRMRGTTYLDDGAIQPEDLTADGRHETPADEHAWHVLSVDAAGNVGACLRYLDERHSTGFRGLWVSHAAMAHCPRMGWKLRKAVEFRMQRARASRIGFGSVGGWAAAPGERRTMEPVSVILATYGLLELLGGCIGVATATFRHHSAGILRKIGLSPLTWSGAELPAYFDPKYGCEMEILEFDSAHPNPKYSESVARFGEQLANAAVICAETASLAAAPQSVRFLPQMAAVA